MKSLSTKKFEEATKLHQILKIALQDLKAVEKMKEKYQVNMLDWYKPNPDTQKCYVCLAGSVIARRYESLAQQKIDINPTYDCVEPSDFSEVDEVEDKLQALNALRTGSVLVALRYLDPNPRIEELGLARYMYREITSYDGPNGKWWKAITILLKDLKDADL